jgi:2-C-methyl-D-erythritol 2,4-cyclodiphosphate synthase
LRVGIGYDAHKLASGRPLILGGIEISKENGLEGHSDGDVLIHSIIDALLGAAALGDIGQHFPSDDPALAGIKSTVMLTKVQKLLDLKGWRALNIDATIVAEKPRLTPYICLMRKEIGALLAIESQRVSVKATTTDGLGFTGNLSGVTCHSVALIESKT